MATIDKQTELERRIGRIDELIGRLEAGADPALRATAKELIQSVMDLHGAGLERMVDIMRRTGQAGEAVLGQLARDELVRNVLLLYGLHPVDVETRVREALEKARPYLRSHGGDVDLVGVGEDGSVRLRLQGTCHGCPSSSVTLKLAVEQAIRDAAPDITTILVEGDLAVTATATNGATTTPTTPTTPTTTTTTAAPDTLVALQHVDRSTLICPIPIENGRAKFALPLARVEAGAP